MIRATSAGGFTFRHLKSNQGERGARLTSRLCRLGERDEKRKTGRWDEVREKWRAGCLRVGTWTGWEPEMPSRPDPLRSAPPPVIAPAAAVEAPGRVR